MQTLCGNDFSIHKNWIHIKSEWTKIRKFPHCSLKTEIHFSFQCWTWWSKYTFYQPMISQLNSIVTWNHVNWPMIHHKSYFATLNNALDKYFDPADFMGTLWQLGTFVPKSFVAMCVAQPHRVDRNADFSKSAQRRVHCWEIHQFQKSKRFGRSWTTRTLVSKKSSGGAFHKYNWKILWGAECEHLYVYKTD